MLRGVMLDQSLTIAIDPKSKLPQIAQTLRNPELEFAMPKELDIIIKQRLLPDIIQWTLA